MGYWNNGQYVDHVNDINDLKTSGMVPTEEQAKYTPQEKTLNAVTVGAGGVTNFTSNVINMDGFTYLGAGGSADASHSWNFYAYPSTDGSLIVTKPIVTDTGASSTKGGAGISPFNFAVLQIQNNDAVTRTYNIWTRKFNV